MKYPTSWWPQELQQPCPSRAGSWIFWSSAKRWGWRVARQEIRWNLFFSQQSFDSNWRDPKKTNWFQWYSRRWCSSSIFRIPWDQQKQELFQSKSQTSIFQYEPSSYMLDLVLFLEGTSGCSSFCGPLNSWTFSVGLEAPEGDGTTPSTVFGIRWCCLWRNTRQTTEFVKLMTFW